MDLDELSGQLRSVFGANTTVDRSDNTLLIRFRSCDAEVGVTIADRGPPSFNVTYPALREQSSTIRDAQQQAVSGVLFDEAHTEHDMVARAGRKLD